MSKLIGRVIVVIAVCVVAGALLRSNLKVAAQAQTPARDGASPARQVLGQPIYELNDRTMLRWPLPASAPQYGTIDGFKLKPYVNKLIQIAEKSHKDGHQWWGRITGTPYYDETQQWVEERLREAEAPEPPGSSCS